MDYTKEPLYNYQTLYWRFDNFFSVADSTFDLIQRKLPNQSQETLLDNFRKHVEDEILCEDKDVHIFDLIHRAKLNLEALFVTHNNGEKRLIKKINTEYGGLVQKAKFLEDKHPIGRKHKGDELGSSYRRVKKHFDEFINWLIEYEVLNPINDAISAAIPLTKMPTFDSKLNKEQLAILASLINEISLFKNETNLDELENLFKCALTNSIEVTSNINLAFVLDSLHTKGLICYEWKNVAEKNQIFIGKRGTILSASNLSVSRTSVNLKAPQIKLIESRFNSL